MNRTAAILVLITLSGCAATPVVDSDPAPVTPPPAEASPDEVQDSRERAMILAEVTAYYRDLSAGEWDAFAQHFWRGAVVTTIWEPADGSERRVDFISVPQFIEQMDIGADNTIIFEQSIATAEVQFDGNVAQVWASYRVRFGEPGNVSEWTDVDAFTLLKHVGMWKISSMAFATK